MPLAQLGGSMPEPEVYRPFEDRSAALTYMCELLGSVAGRALVIVSSKEAHQEMLRLQVGSRQRIQSVEQVPSQQERRNISVASYRTVLQVIRTPYGVHRIDQNAQELVVFDNPHWLAPRLIRLLHHAFSPTQQIRALTTHASPVAERYMREAFSLQSALAFAHPPVGPKPYTPSSWNGDRIAPNWQEQASCGGDGFDPRFNVREPTVWDTIRQQDCPSCPVADSCLAAGLVADQQNASKRQRLLGAWGGLTEYARRELRTALHQGASSAEAAYLIERARK